MTETFLIRFSFTNLVLELVGWGGGSGRWAEPDWAGLGVGWVGLGSGWVGLGWAEGFVRAVRAGPSWVG